MVVLVVDGGDVLDCSQVVCIDCQIPQSIDTPYFFEEVHAVGRSN